MDLRLKPGDDSTDDQSFQHLSDCVGETSSFFELMQGWLTEQRSIACMRSDETTDHVIGISFEQDEAGVAVGMLPSSEAIKMTPGIAVIPATKDDAVLDEFIEKRNERLDIEFNEELQIFVCPPAALHEVLFSYALAEKGFSQARFVQHENGDPFAELFLVILTASGTPDWGETLHLPLKPTK